MKRFAMAVVFACLPALAVNTAAPPGGELRFCLYSEPRSFNPLTVSDASSEAIRYMTAGVLIRASRETQELQPELATAWKVSRDGRSIWFHLRERVYFSDGTPFTARDVAYTMRALLDPALHSPTADSFHAASADLKVDIQDDLDVRLTFPQAIGGLERLFDQVGILSEKSPKKELATLGPFSVGPYKPGSEVVLNRNPFYWKRGPHGESLPLVDTVRLYIQQNRDLELVRFERGELDLITSVSPELFAQLESRRPQAVRDLGVSLESEMMWFNQSPKAPIRAYARQWFESTDFRRAVSAAIFRDDLCRVVFHGHARPAEGPISPANKFWFNAGLKPQPYDPRDALERLAKAGFRLKNGVLYDAASHAVEFSVITNAGNHAREQMAQMIQEDLKAIGIRLNIVKLDYAGILERLTRSFDYEACLLGLTNVDLDPDGQMNVWLSSAANHQWNPSQAAPATAWEAEIDALMKAQQATRNQARRKAAFDRVQEIVAEQAPFLYLVTRNALVAVSPGLLNAKPVVLRPYAYWNIDALALAPEVRNRP